MNLKKNLDLIIRFFTGVIYISIIIFSIENGIKVFRVIMMIISSFCLSELLLISNINFFFIKIIPLFFLPSIILDFLIIKNGFTIYIIFIIIYIITFFVTQLFSKKISNYKKLINISCLSFGIVYIIIPFYLSCYIYDNIIFGNKIILGTFILIWVNDSISYLIGKMWGEKKIAISISPNKSLEGCIGGLISCLILGVFFYKIWHMKYWILLSFVIPIFGTIGDLIESIIKRSHNVKNSGIFLPGHGGFLDRLDSFIFVIPVIFIIMKIIYIF